MAGVFRVNQALSSITTKTAILIILQDPPTKNQSHFIHFYPHLFI